MIIINSIDREEIEIDEHRTAVKSGLSVEVKNVSPGEALFQLVHATEEISGMFSKLHSNDCDEKDCPPMKMAAMINRHMQEIQEEIKIIQAVDYVKSTKHNK